MVYGTSSHVRELRLLTNERINEPNPSRSQWYDRIWSFLPDWTSQSLPLPTNNPWPVPRPNHGNESIDRFIESCYYFLTKNVLLKGSTNCYLIFFLFCRPRKRHARILERMNRVRQQPSLLQLLLRLSAAFRKSRRIADNNDHRISPQKHLADVPVLVDGLPSGFPLSSLGVFRPHFLDILQKPARAQQQQ